jgi:hypothetical protein
MDNKIYDHDSDISDLQDSVDVLEPTASSSDVGKALKVKTVAGGKATAYEFGETAIIDNTLTQTGQAADAKKTGDEITGLKSALDNLINESENIFDGLFVKNEQIATSSGAFVNGPGYSRTEYIPVSAGVVNIGVQTSSDIIRTGVHYALYNKSKVKLSSGTTTNLTKQTASDIKYVQIAVSESGYFAFDIDNVCASFNWYVSQKSNPAGYTEYDVKIKDEYIHLDKTLTKEGVPSEAKTVGNIISEVNSNIEFINEKLYTVGSDTEVSEKTELDLSWTSDYYINATNDKQSAPGFKYSNRISVNTGDIISPNSVGLRFVCAYSGDTVVSSEGSNALIPNYEVKEGITEIVVSVASSVTNIYKTVKSAIYKINGIEDINNLKNRIKTIGGADITCVKADTLSFGNGLYLSRNSIFRNKTYVFKADVSGMDWSVLLAHGPVDSSFDANTYSQGIIITPETISTWGNGNNGENGTQGTPASHGVTIMSRLLIVIHVDDVQHYKVVLISESGSRTIDYETNVWQGRKGNIYAKALAGTFSNAYLTFACRDIEKPVWIFGDSYLSEVAIRWPYWTNYANIDNCLLNSYPGEASPNALLDFKALLNFGIPRFLVWCLGMNDHDGSNNPNANWKAVVEELMQICKEKGIELILATIPNVAHTSYNNVQKNIYVKDSNYRYIDFAKAIGAAEQVGATWPEGWLSSDNIHPTEMGARVLAMQVIADVPEIAMP